MSARLAFQPMACLGLTSRERSAARRRGEQDRRGQVHAVLHEPLNSRGLKLPTAHAAAGPPGAGPALAPALRAAPPAPGVLERGLFPCRGRMLYVPVSVSEDGVATATAFSTVTSLVRHAKPQQGWCSEPALLQSQAHLSATLPQRVAVGFGGSLWSACCHGGPCSSEAKDAHLQDDCMWRLQGGMQSLNSSYDSAQTQ